MSSWNRATGTLCLSVLLGVSCFATARPARAQETTEAPDGDGEKDAYSREIDAALESYNADDYLLAREHFLKAHQLRPSARTWRGLGTTAFELRAYEDAIRELTFALEDTRNALPPDLRTETELTLRVARRRLADRRAAAEAAAQPNEQSARTAPAKARALDAWDSKAPPSATAQTHQPPRDTGLGTARVAAIVAGSTGLVALAVGAGFGLQSLSKGRERDDLCPPAQQPACSEAAKDAADAAIVAGNISTVTVVAGAALLTGGVVLWLVGGAAEPSTSNQARLSLGPTGLELAGRF